MSRFTELFKAQKNLLSLYVMAGFPQLNDTAGLCEALQNAGVDFLEIGIPFSDPVADGPTIQRASEIALKNGMTLSTLFEQLKEIRKKVSIPLILMGYINPVLQFGIESFCQKAQECGIDGVILPDLPLEVYLESYQALFKQHGIANIFLVTSRTSDERIQLIDQHSDGFIYLVSSDATTGGVLSVDAATEAYFKKIQSLKLKSPTVVGFGVSNHQAYQRACMFADGAIVASAFMRWIEQHGVGAESIQTFVKSIREDV